MTFSEYAKRLKTIIGDGENTKAFTKSLLEFLIPEEDDLLDSYDDDTFKKYYNGSLPINKIAQKILPRIQSYNYQEYLYEYGDDVGSALADTFSDVLPQINEHNFGEELSKLLVKILIDASSTPKKNSKESSDIPDMNEDQKEIFDNLKGPLLTFARAADSIVHDAAEKSRQNKKDHANAQSDVESFEGEIVTDEESSTTDSSSSTTVIQHQTNIVQNGDNNVNINNSGTINFNF